MSKCEVKYNHRTDIKTVGLLMQSLSIDYLDTADYMRDDKCTDIGINIQLKRLKNLTEHLLGKIEEYNMFEEREYAKEG